MHQNKMDDEYVELDELRYRVSLIATYAVSLISWYGIISGMGLGINIWSIRPFFTPFDTCLHNQPSTTRALPEGGGRRKSLLLTLFNWCKL
jgi:hypothetical protein